MTRRHIFAAILVVLLPALLVGTASAQVVRPAVPRPPSQRASIPLRDRMALAQLEGPVPQVRFQLLTAQLDFGSVKPGTTPSAVLEATVEGWDAICIAVLLPPGEERAALSRRDANGDDASIPTTWRLRWNGGSAWSPWLQPTIGATPQSAEAALWWDVGEPGRVVYQVQLRCELATAPLQLAGSYGANVRLMAVPGPAFPGEQKRSGGPRHERIGAGDGRAGTEDGNRWLRHRRGAIRVPPGPTARWQRRSAAGVPKWTRRSHMP